MKLYQQGRNFAREREKEAAQALFFPISDGNLESMGNKTASTNQKYALLSVFDKTGIVEFAQKLSVLGYAIVSTGGTAKVLTENNIKVVPIQEVTGNPESFDGRMKTISFQIESGILYDRTNPSHVKQAEELGIKPVDMVVCNLYPFEAAVKDEHVTLDVAIENIDVGGPTMVRSAGKNFKNVLVVVDPADYSPLAETLASGDVPFEERRRLAAKAFGHLSFYDSQVAQYLRTETSYPVEITLPGRKTIDLRYGENPHQPGAVYMEPNTNSPLKNLTKRAGRELSLINVTDINAGLEAVRLFAEPAAVVIKHNSPCGIAVGSTAKEALDRAIQSDPESAFGGIIVLNKPMDRAAAEMIGAFKDETKGNMDIVAAPAIDEETVTYLKTLRKTMGIYTFGEIPAKRTQPYNIKWIDGGYILQAHDDGIEESFADWKVVTKIQPTPEQMKQMQVAWKFISRIRSNAILVVDKTIPMTRGIGSGQTSRVRSTKLALEQAGEYTKGGILASDSFFPFDDSVKLAVKHGIAAIVQQGGSINDKLSIAAADEAGIPMVLTGRRAFWH
ncbi:bifunctional phosphoribosylaminoimidazolecarboxamide formyltransferase/IMP cyclohydrolase [Candidatus Roizmanbacteria bacterium]|nr:bifunctional phosphoribosylaminoimidazolecarboxamide formyltransferase/IMP cyclohydrolase [Candidatus Roizmanbacteria bacterium]